MLRSNVNPTAYLKAIDAAHHLHPFSDPNGLAREGSRVIVRAEGCWLIDSDGNRILDGMAGLWCVNVGHGREEIVEAVAEQMHALAYSNTFFKTTHPPAAELGETLARLAPPQMNHVFFTNSGSEANDTVIRLVRHYWAAKGMPDKQVIIARKNAYHGSTVAAGTLGGMAPMHRQGCTMPNVHHIDQPYWFGEGGDLDPDAFGIEAARALERAIDEIGEENVAAFIAEPIQGAGGVIVPPATYWPEVKRILSERDILFVSDEVICGFGRLGRWFGHELYGTVPDLMPIAKGLSSGYLPIGGVMVSDKVAEVVGAAGEFHHGFTYSGHPAACAAALANLDIMERENLPNRVANDIGPYMREKWLALGDHPLVGEARITGLVGALELVPQKPSRGAKWPKEGTAGLVCRDLSVRNGLIMRHVRDTMVIAPPLVISRGEVDELVGIARRTLDETHAELRRQGLTA